MLQEELGYEVLARTTYCRHAETLGYAVPLRGTWEGSCCMKHLDMWFLAYVDAACLTAWCGPKLKRTRLGSVISSSTSMSRALMRGFAMRGLLWQNSYERVS